MQHGFVELPALLSEDLCTALMAANMASDTSYEISNARELDCPPEHWAAVKRAVESSSVVREAMQRVYTSLDDTLVYHTRTSNSSEVLNAIDIITQVFQTHMPEQLHELLSGNITVAEFEAATSLEAMGLVYDADCAAIRCEAAGVYDAAVLQKQPAAATAPPSSGDDDIGAMSNGTIAGIAVAMLLLGACCCLFLSSRPPSGRLA